MSLTILSSSPQNTIKENLRRGSMGESLIKRKKSSLGEEETTLIRDTFILNMLDFDAQKELHKETESPIKAHQIVIHMEMGAQNQQKTNQRLNTNAQSVNIVINFQGLHCTTNNQQQWKDFTRYLFVPQNYE